MYIYTYVHVYIYIYILILYKSQHQTNYSKPNTKENKTASTLGPNPSYYSIGLYCIVDYSIS